MQQDLRSLFQLPGQIKEWDATQLEAIHKCLDLTKRIVPITGKAGSGKTSIIEIVYNKLVGMGYSVACTAPTGKAAKRIKEITGIEAMTNHRLLGYGQPYEQEVTDEDTGKKVTIEVSTGPYYKKDKRLDYDILLCDEYAMVNWEIHRALLDAMKMGSHIRMFGDINQLKPIEEDRKLQDEPSAFFTMLKKFKGIELTVQHRQYEGSGVAENAGRLLRGLPLARKDDFAIVYTDVPVKVLMDEIRRCQEQDIDYSTADHQIITCMNQSWVGTVKLNAALQNIFWKRDLPHIDLPRWKEDNSSVRVQIGTKVVYSANTYSFNNGDYAFNGETGNVVDILHDGTIVLDLVDRIVQIPPNIVVEGKKKKTEFDPRKNIDLAYALTTHKMQGSEAQHVIYVMNKSTIYGQSRRNLYTGITRARKHCTIICDQGSMAKSLKYPG